MSQENSFSIGRLVLIPGLISLAVTILRLTGELQGWSQLFFNTQPAGGGGLVGIVWLVPVFGIYFALKLANAGERPISMAKAAGFTFLGLLMVSGGIALTAASEFQNFGLIVGGGLVMIAAMLVPLWGWTQLTKALLAYGFFARIPVAIINFLSMQESWARTMTARLQGSLLTRPS